MSLPNLRQALGENFLDSDSGYEDYTSDSDDGNENILEKSCGEDVSDMSDEDFPVRRKKRLWLLYESCRVVARELCDSCATVV